MKLRFTTKSSMPSSFQLYATEHMGSFYEGIVQEFFSMVDVTLHYFQSRQREHPDFTLISFAYEDIARHPKSR